MDDLPPKLELENVEIDFSNYKEHIQEIDHLHQAEIKDHIDLFLQEWGKVKKREIGYLICKDELHLEHAQYRDIQDLLDSFSKWQSSHGKS